MIPSLRKWSFAPFLGSAIGVFSSEASLGSDFKIGRRLVWIIPVSSMAFAPPPSFASETFCAVTERTSDGFVSVRSGPGTDYNVLGKVHLSDFLYVGTERCRNDFGPTLCSEDGRWVFVEEVRKQSKVFVLKGWIKNSLIRQVTCPDD